MKTGASAAATALVWAAFSSPLMAASSFAIKAMSAADQGSVCRAEGDAVRSLLSSDSVGFRNLLSERMAAMKQ